MSEPNYIILTVDEIRALNDYFNRAGYISYEYDMPIILLIRRLAAAIKIIDEENG